ncbi:MAG TPA: branched-chain amino acid ABC transporter permease, partial [Burkholderiaceae bacterium]|nr:branched-chain amino acid ABC transporter permease [Burkholderiaceae bacterium]
MRIGDFRETYRHDEALWPTPTSRAWLAVLAVALVAFPFGANGYVVGLGCLLGIHMIAAAGLNIMTGYTGLISLGHAAFMGVGCYTAAWLAQQGAPVLVTLPAAGAMAALLGLVVGIPSLRIKGLYLAVATLA